MVIDLSAVLLILASHGWDLWVLECTLVLVALPFDWLRAIWLVNGLITYYYPFSSKSHRGHTKVQPFAQRVEFGLCVCCVCLWIFYFCHLNNTKITCCAVAFGGNKASFGTPGYIQDDTKRKNMKGCCVSWDIWNNAKSTNEVFWGAMGAMGVIPRKISTWRIRQNIEEKHKNNIKTCKQHIDRCSRINLIVW